MCFNTGARIHGPRSSFFAAAVAIDARRVRAKRRECCCCCKSDFQAAEGSLRSDRMRHYFEHTHTPFLLKPPVKAAVGLIFTAMLQANSSSLVSSVMANPTPGPP